MNNNDINIKKKINNDDLLWLTFFIGGMASIVIGTILIFLIYYLLIGLTYLCYYVNKPEIINNLQIFMFEKKSIIIGTGILADISLTILYFLLKNLIGTQSKILIKCGQVFENLFELDINMADLFHTYKKIYIPLLVISFILMAIRLII